MTRRSMPILPAAIGVAVAVVAGCKVDQQKEVATYRQVIDLPTTRAAATTRPFVEGQPLSLREAMLLTNSQNERLSIQGEDYLQALIARKRAVAAFLPAVNFAPTYARRDGGYGSGANTGTGGEGQLDWVVASQINLFNGFRDVAALESAKFTAEQRKWVLLDLRESILLDVARVYYQIMRAEQNVEVLKNSLEVQEARVRDVRGKQAAGTARPLDVAQTESRASSTRVTLIDAENNVQNGRTLLAFLTNSPVKTSPLTTEPELVEAGDLERWIADAMASREDLKAARAGVLAAEKDVKVAVGEYYPSVNLNFNYFLQRDSFPTDSDWTALLAVNLPIFSGGTIQADVRTAWSRLRQAGLSESLMRRQVRQDVETAYQDLVDSARRLDELKVEVRAAEQAFRQADQSYNVGLATNLERLTAQDEFLAAQLRLSSETYDRQVTYLDLLRASGRLVQTVAIDPK